MADENSHEAFWRAACQSAEARAANQAEHIQAMRYAGNELARVLGDLMQADGQITCGISRAVITASLAKWKRAKEGQP
jgi:flagellar biosynthesis regulator FlaF